MYRIAVGAFSWAALASEAWAHAGHGAPALHSHGWEYALLGAAVVAAFAAAAVRWLIKRK